MGCQAEFFDVVNLLSELLFVVFGKVDFLVYNNARHGLPLGVWYGDCFAVFEEKAEFSQLARHVSNNFFVIKLSRKSHIVTVARVGDAFLSLLFSISNAILLSNKGVPEKVIHVKINTATMHGIYLYFVGSKNTRQSKIIKIDVKQRTPRTLNDVFLCVNNGLASKWRSTQHAIRMNDITHPVINPTALTFKSQP